MVEKSTKYQQIHLLSILAAAIAATFLLLIWLRLPMHLIYNSKQKDRGNEKSYILENIWAERQRATNWLEMVKSTTTMHNDNGRKCFLSMSSIYRIQKKTQRCTHLLVK